MAYMLCIRLLATKSFLIVNQDGLLGTTENSSLRNKYGLFDDLIDVQKIAANFSSDLQIGRDYRVVEIKITDEIQEILDIRLLVNTLHLLLRLIKDEIPKQVFVSELKNFKKKWSWYNYLQWFSGKKAQNALLAMNADDYKQAKVTRNEATALRLAVLDLGL